MHAVELDLGHINEVLTTESEVIITEDADVDY
jgi:hypothetical protein